jgi:hypothetical protein
MDDIRREQAFVAVVISTSFSQPLTSSEILIPDTPHVQQQTQLGKVSVAVCNWLVLLKVGDIRGDRNGRLQPNLLRQVFDAAGITLPGTR